MRFKEYLQERHVNWAKISKEIKELIEKLKNNINTSRLTDDVFMLGSYREDKKNVLIISGSHGTESGAPFAIYELANKKEFLNKNINFVYIPLLNPISFMTGFRDISTKDDIAIKDNLEFLRKFDIVISLHEDHNMKLANGFYVYVIDKKENAQPSSYQNLIDLMIKLDFSVESRLSYNEVDGLLFNKFLNIPEEELVTKENMFIRTEISGKNQLNEKIESHQKILDSLFDYVTKIL